MTGSVLRERGEDAATVRTYSYAFDDLRAVDERHVSDQIVAHYGFTPVAIAADERWPLRDYPAHGPSRNGPFGGVYQALIEHALARARRDDVGVLLWGIRGDVVVGETIFDTLGLLLSGRWQAVWLELQAYRRWRGTSLPSAVRRLLVRDAASAAAARWPRASLRRGRRSQRTLRPPPWVLPDFLARAGGADLADADRGPLASGRRGPRQQRHDAVFSSLLETGMTWSERMHAQAGLSFADPWSDRRLAEFVIAAPQWIVQRVHRPKHLAREAMRGVMPEGARRQIAKVLPNALYQRALEDRATGVIEELLRAPRAEARGYVDGEALRRHYADVRGGGPAHPGLWQALTLEMWLRAHHAL
jgi:asparagine synthase (glutamine-hydrolysing)